jgi:hypothetical protein
MSIPIESFLQFIDQKHRLDSYVNSVDSCCFVHDYVFKNRLKDHLPEKSDDIFTVFAVGEDFCDNKSIRLKVSERLSFPPDSTPPHFTNDVTFSTGVSYPAKVTKTYKSRFPDAEKVNEYLQENKIDTEVISNRSLGEKIRLCILSSDQTAHFWYHQAFAIRIKSYQQKEDIYVYDPTYYQTTSYPAEGDPKVVMQNVALVPLKVWQKNIRESSMIDSDKKVYFSKPIAFGEKLTLDHLDVSDDELIEIRNNNNLESRTSYFNANPDLEYMKNRMPGEGNAWDSEYFVVNLKESAFEHANKWLKFNLAMKQVNLKEHSVLIDVFSEIHEEDFDDFCEQLGRDYKNASNDLQRIEVIETAKQKLEVAIDEAAKSLPNRIEHLQQYIDKKIQSADALLGL